MYHGENQIKDLILFYSENLDFVPLDVIDENFKNGTLKRLIFPKIIRIKNLKDIL